MTRNTTTLLSRSRRRALLGLATAAVLTTSALALPAGAASATQAPTTCPTPFPEGSITKGQTVNGLTVSSGTTPEEFTGTVVGVLDDGIQPGTDMIIMKLDSAAIDAAGGIWEGMSGSPVYDDVTGELIGAVSYGLASGPSPVAGITPYASMTKYLPGGSAPAKSPVAAKKVDVDSLALTSRIAAAAGVPADEAGSFRRLILPSVKGAAAGRGRALTAKVKTKHAYVGHYLSSAHMGGTKAPADAPGADTLVPGGNVAAATVWGDVTEGGVGTVTAVCHGGLVAFGHPMNAVGATTTALMTADTLYVQNDPVAPFKVANFGQVAGTITKDGFTGIGGTVGKMPATATFTSTSSYDGSRRTGHSYSSVRDFYADGAFGEMTVNNDAVLDSVTKGGALVTYAVKGTAAGKPFTLAHTDRYVSSADISYDSSWDLGDLVYALSSLPNVKITSVTTKSALDHVTATRSVTAVQQKRGGRWVKVTQKSPVVVKAGKRAQLRFVLTGRGSTRYATTSIWAPYRLKGSVGFLDGSGGGESYADVYDASTFNQVKKAVADKVRGDAVGVQVVVRHKGVDPLKRSLRLGPVDKVVYGEVYVPFAIR